jgi:hypothetical protein
MTLRKPVQPHSAAQNGGPGSERMRQNRPLQAEVPVRVRICKFVARQNPTKRVVSSSLRGNRRRYRASGAGVTCLPGFSNLAAPMRIVDRPANLREKAAPGR